MTMMFYDGEHELAAMRARMGPHVEVHLENRQVVLEHDSGGREVMSCQGMRISSFDGDRLIADDWVPCAEGQDELEDEKLIRRLHRAFASLPGNPRPNLWSTRPLGHSCDNP